MISFRKGEHLTDVPKRGKQQVTARLFALTRPTESKGLPPDTGGNFSCPWPRSRVKFGFPGSQRQASPSRPCGGHQVMVPAEVTQSITRLIRAAQGGRDSAAGPLLGAYFDRLVHLARKRLQGLPGMADYDEDVA